MPLEGIDLGFRHSDDRWLFRHVNILVASGTIVGLAGRSGTGKTTLGKLLAGYLVPVEGEVRMAERRQPGAPDPVQMVFQHPEQAVNPRWRIGKMLEESRQPGECLPASLGIRQSWLQRYPHELSGGELQRCCIARALAPSTRFLIADEMTTMLDPITQAQIWHAVLAIARARSIGLLVISHDHALLSAVCDHVVELENLDDRR